MSELLSVRDISLDVPEGHLWRRRKKRVLDRVSFSVRQGKATAYLGPNGAGKTSTFRILCGLCRADEGRVLFEGNPVERGIPPQRYGFMPEHPYFFKRLTPNELLHALGALSGMPASRIPSAIRHWSKRLDFAHVLNQPLHRCSKGQVQRVGIAQAMMHEPALVILDEPLSGLDPIGREQVKEVLREAVDAGGTILFSSHILSDAEDICDETIILNRGKVLFQGPMDELTKTTQGWTIEYHGPPPPERWRAKARHIKNKVWRITCCDARTKDEIIRWALETEHCELTRVGNSGARLEHAFIHLLEHAPAMEEHAA